jgi:hypothetical protein
MRVVVGVGSSIHSLTWDGTGRAVTLDCGRKPTEADVQERGILTRQGG